MGSLLGDGKADGGTMRGTRPKARCHHFDHHAITLEASRYAHQTLARCGEAKHHRVGSGSERDDSGSRSLDASRDTARGIEACCWLAAPDDDKCIRDASDASGKKTAQVRDCVVGSYEPSRS
jgi:hypothetical protein